MPGTCDPCPGNKNATLIAISILLLCEAGSAVCTAAQSEAREAARYLPFEVLLSNVRCGLFDQTCSLLGRGEFSGHDCCPLSENICRSARRGLSLRGDELSQGRTAIQAVQVGPPAILAGLHFEELHGSHLARNVSTEGKSPTGRAAYILGQRA